MGRADRIFRRLLRLFPSEFRGDFGDDMAETFRDQRLDTAATGGAAAHVNLWWQTIRGIVTTAPREHVDLLRQDVRYSLRSLRRSPTFSLVSAIVLGVGIGAATAMFSVVDGVLWRALPYDKPEELARVRNGQSYPDLHDWTDAAHSFSGFGGYRPQSFDLAGADGLDRLPGALVTGTLFGALGLQPHRGRLIGPADDQPGAEHVMVLGHSFWTRRFGSREDIVGQVVDVIGTRYRVIGVLPAGFELPLTPADVFAPALAESTEFAFRGVHSLSTVGRVKPDVTLAVAQAEMDAIATELEATYPAQNTGRRFVLQDLRSGLVGAVEPTLLLLFAAVALLLFIACANLATLLLSRSVERQPEMAVRAALGASRPRLLRQLFVESLTLFVIGGAVGLILAAWLLDVMLALGPSDVPRLASAGLDARVVLFAAAASVVTSIVFGWLPARSVTRASLPSLGGDVSRATMRRRRFGATLIAVEIAMTVVLMVGAGLLVNSVARLKHVDAGFDLDHLLTFNLTLRQPPRPKERDTPAQAAARTAAEIAGRSRFFDQVLDGLRAVPGVTAAASSTDLPIAEGSSYHNLTIEGRAVPPGSEPEVYFRGISPGFFGALGIPLKRGRALSPADSRDTPPVVVANETFVRQHFPAEDPIGKRVSWSSSSPSWITIVGVVADVKGEQLDADEVPALYGPYSQDQAGWRRSMDFVVRVSGNPTSMAADVRRVVGNLDGTLPVLRMKPMADLINESIGDRRFALSMLGAFALTALGLAAVGLYGVLAYSVRTRTRELGLRMALGARPSDVVGLVVRQACWLTGVGLVLGLAGAYAAVGALTSLLFQIAPTDAPTYMLASVVVVATALVAASVPAIRAARIDPLIALRR